MLHVHFISSFLTSRFSNNQIHSLLVEDREKGRIHIFIYDLSERTSRKDK